LPPPRLQGALILCPNPPPAYQKRRGVSSPFLPLPPTLGQVAPAPTFFLVVGPPRSGTPHLTHLSPVRGKCSPWHSAGDTGHTAAPVARAAGRTRAPDESLLRRRQSVDHWRARGASRSLPECPRPPGPRGPRLVPHRVEIGRAHV